MEQRFSERAIVIIKRSADEIMVTWLRTKQAVNDKEVRGKGLAMVMRMETYYEPDIRGQPTGTQDYQERKP